MEHRWDLSTIYPGFDSAQYQGDLTAVAQEITAAEQIPLTEDFETSAISIINHINALYAKLAPLGTYAGLVFSTDTGNAEALKYLNKVEELSAALTGPQVKFTKWLRSFSPEIIDKSTHPLIVEHRFFLHETYKEASHMLSDAEEILLAKLQTVGSSAWSNLQGKLTSDLMIEFELEGEVKSLSLSMIRNLANHPVQEVRKRAYVAELASYERIEEGVAAALNAIKGEVNIISKLRGFESPLHQSASGSKLDMETLNAMIEAMKEKLPAFHKYLQRKAQLLGHQGGLPFYDLFAPISESSLTFTYEQAQAFILENFAAFSPELSNYAKTVFDNQWIDVEPKKGKRGGAFCAGVGGRKQSRIMLNFDGSFSEVSTLAHELGHGYHNSQVYSETLINSGYPMPVAETASIFCETIVTNAAIKTASADDAVFILEKSIEGATQVIVDILSRFLFEKSIFDERIEGPITVEQIKALMLKAQREAYGDGLDQNLHPYMWACKPHYYSSGFSFYNYPYAFGLLFGKGLYAQYKAGKPNFVEDYNRLLNNTTKMNARDVAATMGLDIAKKDFWLASLTMVEDEINQFIQLTEARL